MANNPPRRIDIRGQDHMLAYITPEEGGILQLLGGSGAPGPMGIPSFYQDDAADSGTGPGASSDDDGVSEDDPDNVDYSGVDETGQDDDMDYTDVDYGYTTPTQDSGFFGFFNRPKDEMQRAKEIGLQQYSPVENVPYDFLNMKDKMNQHARDSLARGVTPTFSRDAQGNITSVTGAGGASGMPGIGGLMSMIGANMGAVTTTGYAGKGVDDTDIGGNENDDQDIVKDARTFLGEDIAEIDDDKVVGESFIDPELYRYLQGRRAAPSVVVSGYGQDIVGASSAKPVDFSAIDRGLQKTQSGIQAINRYR